VAGSKSRTTRRRVAAIPTHSGPVSASVASGRTAGVTPHETRARRLDGAIKRQRHRDDDQPDGKLLQGAQHGWDSLTSTPDPEDSESDAQRPQLSTTGYAPGVVLWPSVCWAGGCPAAGRCGGPGPKSKLVTFRINSRNASSANPKIKGVSRHRCGQGETLISGLSRNTHERKIPLRPEGILPITPTPRERLHEHSDQEDQIRHFEGEDDAWLAEPRDTPSRAGVSRWSDHATEECYQQRTDPSKQAHGTTLVHCGRSLTLSTRRRTQSALARVRNREDA